jgi:NAD(P)-dependent dehydrogenase (short-subunit alcohol dehydrogenase family)
MKLKNKGALITGAGRGIGAAIAARFAQEGARVGINDVNDEIGRKTVEAIREAGGEAVYLKADVSSAAEVRAMIAQTVEQFGALHILVNNAAYGHWGGKPAHELAEQEWDRVLGVCLKGAFLCAKYAIPEIIKAGGGSIINIASIAGFFGFSSDTAYMSAKGGLLQLSKAMAVDYAPHNIRVNAISPGWAATPMNAKQRSDSEFMRIALRGPLIKRPAEPQEIAEAAVYLASDAAAYITGANLVIDGGWTARSALGFD